MFGCAARRRCDKSAAAMCNERRPVHGVRLRGEIHPYEIQKREMNVRSIVASVPSPSQPVMRAAWAFVFLCLGLLFAQVVTAKASNPLLVEWTKPGEPSGARAAADREGTVPTKDGLTLRITTDLGSVKIVPLPANAAPVVRYTVHLETDARAPLAERLLDRYSLTAEAGASGVEINGALPPQLSRSSSAVQFWVQFEIAVPRGYNVEVKTDAGDIETQDIGGTALLSTQGGNIRAGCIGANSREAGAGRLVAKLETEGGHIQVLDVAGDLNAFTAGGHINARNITGDALLHSGGGHIRAGQIAGRADLETDGGNITVGQAGSLVSVRTGGGQIDFGEVRGSVRAQTGGGGIRVMYVSGPMEVESSAGSICLTRVAGTVRAATAGGSIRAWINPDTPSASGGTVHLSGASQLTSGNGDIIVFLPRNLAADIDALVESGGERRIDADPALGLTMQAGRGSGSIRAVGALNGGGAPLKLRTTSGKIHLRFLDSEIALRDSLIREQKERLSEHGVQLMATGFDTSDPAQVQTGTPAPDDRGDWLENWLDRLQVAFMGGVHEDSEEFKKHLVASPPPSYPEIAKRAGVQGLVKLQVRAARDGHIEVEKLIDGAPSLADAAIAAVKQWRVNPSWVLAKRGDVISTVTFNFQLH
jgi:Gram-negative bacterial TonB protein C-terminal